MTIIANSLIVFDVEGIIIPKRRYLVLQAFKNLGLLKIVQLVLYGIFYEIEVYTLEEALKKIFLLFKGVPMSDFLQTLGSIELIPEVPLVIRKLRENEISIALISSGIPDFVVEELARQFNIEHAYGLQVECVNGILTGEIYGDIVKSNGKAIILEKLFDEGYSKENCIVVADDRNNLSLFPLASKTIGYYPDALVSAECDYTVRGSFKEIVPLLFDAPTNNRKVFSKNDAVREIIHIGSFLIPLVCVLLNIDKNILALIIALVTIGYVFSETIRLLNFEIPLLTTITNMAATGEEEWEFATSPIFFALSISLSLIFFPPEIGFPTITILTLGDGTARVVGKKFGRRAFPYNKDKSIEGTIAGIVLSTLAITSFLFTTPLKGFVASVIGMMIETIPFPINDNLLVPYIAWVVLISLP